MPPAGASDVLGRTAERDRISRFLDRIAGGPGALVLQGEPGIGKTALWSVGVEAAADRGWSVLMARPVQGEAQLTFSGLGDLLAPVPPSVLDGLPIPQRHALDVALLLTPPGESPPDQRAVAVATLGVLRALAETTPVLVAIDDLPFLDRATAATLDYALRRLTFERAGLLATVASVATGTAGRDEAAAVELLALERSLPVERIDLGPLDLAAFADLLDANRARDLGWPDVNRVYEAAAGNPFFGLELLRALDADQARSGPLPVPGSLRASAENRLRQLSPGARAVLLLVAAAGRPSVEQLTAALATPSAVEALDEVEGAGVVTVAAGEVRFAHPILRLVHYSAANGRQRRQAHERLAAATDQPEERARHLALAASGPDEAIACDLDTQARVAHLRGAAAAGAELADLAVQLTPSDDLQARATRLVAAGDLHLAAFDPARARKVLEESVALRGPGPLRAEALHRLARVLAYDESVITSKPLLLEALTEAEPMSLLSAHLHRDLAFILAMSEGMDAVVGHMGAIEMLSDALGDAEFTHQTMAHRALAEFLLGHGLRRDLIEMAISSPSSTCRVAMELRPRVVSGRVLLYADDISGARQLLLAEYDEVMEEGAETDLPLLLMPLVELETWAGRLEVAEGYVAECCSAAAASGATAQVACAHAARAMLRAWRGPAAACREDAERAIEAGLRSGVLYPVAVASHALGLLALAESDPAAAHASLAGITLALQGRGIVDPGFIPLRSIPDDVEALIRMGELNLAEELLEPLAMQAVRLGRASALAAAGRGRALLASARGQSEEATAAVGEALVVYDRIDTPLERGRTLLAASEIARRAKRHADARTKAGLAAAIFAEHGATLWAARADAERGRLDRHRPPGPRAGALTQVERSVAAAVAAGHTNREVAAELYMGLRTVEAHLSSVYRKLGVRSRSELAANWAVLGRHQRDLS